MLVCKPPFMAAFCVRQCVRLCVRLWLRLCVRFILALCITLMRSFLIEIQSQSAHQNRAKVHKNSVIMSFIFIFL